VRRAFNQSNLTYRSTSSLLYSPAVVKKQVPLVLEAVNKVEGAFTVQDRFLGKVRTLPIIHPTPSPWPT
jgi:hypothetical protein